MADDKKDKHEKNPFTKISDGFGKFGALFKKKEDNPVFLEYKDNFKKQRAIAMQYNLVFQKYEECLRDMVECQEKLHNIVQQTYESEWTASYELKDYLRASSVEWDNYKNCFSKLVEEQRIYLSRFDELKKKISLRRKKREEYESAKKDLEAKQQAKKQDQAKLVVAESEYKLRKSEFEKVDAELLAELPDFYESRTTFYQRNIGALAKADQCLYAELLDFLKKAVPRFDNGEERKSKGIAKLPSDAATNPFNESSAATPVSIYPTIPKSDTVRESPTPKHRVTAPPPPISSSSDSRKSTIAATTLSQTPANATPTAPTKPPRISKALAEPETVVGDSPGNPFLSDDSDAEFEEKCEQEIRHCEKTPSPSNSDEARRDSTEAIAVVPDRSPRDGHSSNHDANVSKSPEHCVALRKVKATHKYAAIEEDELAFEKGDIIEVLPWLSEEDAEEGWLRGRREVDGKCGVFPENHTKPV